MTDAVERAASCELRPVSAWIVAGPPGSGKTTLGRALARSASAALLDQDTLTNPFVAVLAPLVGADPGDLDALEVRRRTRAARYTALLDGAVDNVSIGMAVVVVAPFTAECRDPAKWAAAVGRLVPAVVTLLWIDCPGEVLWQRLSARAAPRDHRKLADEGAFLAGLPPRPTVPHVLISCGPVQEQVASLLPR